MPEAHDAYGALRFRDYRRLLCGSVLFSIGMEMQAVAVAWELYERTDSPLALGLTGLAQFLPVLLLALPAGQVADLFNRKFVLMAAQFCGALTSLGLFYVSYWEGPVALVYVFLVMVGVVRAFQVPSRQSLVPQVVPLELLHNAVTWNSTGWQIANMVGPMLGGLVLALFLPSVAYLLTAGLALVCVAFISTIHPRPQVRSQEPRSLQTLLAGLRFVWQTKPILATITLDLFAVLLGGATALLPIFARDILQVGPEGLGWLRAAPSVGAMVMAMVLAHRPPMQEAGKTLLKAVAGFGVATIVFGLSQDFVLSFGMLVLLGALDNISVVIRQTLVQTLTPDAMRGRVSAVNTLFISSSNELGAFESGVAAQLFGPVGAVVLGGVGTLGVVVTVKGLWPELVRLGPLRPGKRVDVTDPPPIASDQEPSPLQEKS